MHATHLLKLDKMYKYEMDATRTVGATERMRDGRTDEAKPIYPLTTSLCVEYNNKDRRTRWNKYTPLQLRGAAGIIIFHLGHQKSWSWSWMTDSHSSCSIHVHVSIGAPIPEIQLFQNLTLKSHGPACGHSSGSHCLLSYQSIYFLFLSHQSALPFLRYSYLKILPWKSTVKIMAKVKIDGYIWGLVSNL